MERDQLRVAAGSELERNVEYTVFVLFYKNLVM